MFLSYLLKLPLATTRPSSLPTAPHSFCYPCELNFFSLASSPCPYIKTQPLESRVQWVLLIIFLNCLTLLALPSLGSKSIDRWGPLGHHTVGSSCLGSIKMCFPWLSSSSVESADLFSTEATSSWPLTAVFLTLPIGVTVWSWPHVHMVSSPTCCIRI